MWRYLSPILIFLVPFSAQSQIESFFESASLIADSIAIDAEGNLTAKGHVEIHHNQTILKAQEIYYLRSSDKLSAKGPLILIDSNLSCWSANFISNRQITFINKLNSIFFGCNTQPIKNQKQ